MRLNKKKLNIVILVLLVGNIACQILAGSSGDLPLLIILLAAASIALENEK